MLGYAGNILHVDLTTKKTKIENVSEEFCKKFIGGIGFATRLVYENTKPKIDALGPNNTLAFATGPLNGTLSPSSSWFAVAAKSPLSGFIGKYISSGLWARELKLAGYDAIVIHGRADKLIYLSIDDNDVQFKDAEPILGKSSIETQNLIREELGDLTTRICSIGLAGEKLVRFASILVNRNPKYDRAGLGAVMGSKNLKAIALRGSKSIQVANGDELVKTFLDLKDKCQGKTTEKYRILGTPGNMLVFNGIACLPTRNWKQAIFEEAEKVSGEQLLEHYVRNISACPSCAIACNHNCRIKTGSYIGAAAMVDYEPLWALGPNCGIDKLPSIVKGIALCDYYGMDAIATGGVIAWAMECYERALLTEKEVDGLELKFGNDEACVQLISKIARREGIGDLLSQGTRTASRKVGNGSEQFAMNIKGLELPGYDIRGLKTAALCWAVATKGGCDLSDAYDMDITSKVGRFTAKRGCCRLVVETEDYYSLFDSLTICKFMRGVFEDFYTEAARLYEVVTGFETKADDLEKAGERIINLEKAFNIREGWTRKDDHLPSRVMRDPIPEGIAKGSLVTQEELDLMLDGYYEARGWTKAGLIPKKKLIEIGLTDIAEEVGV